MTSAESAPITEAEFVVIYGDYPISVEDLSAPITIKVAVAMEAAFCPAPAEARTDKTDRLTRLAGFVGSAALCPEHRWLLNENPK